MDTYSFIIHIKTKYFFEDIADDVEKDIIHQIMKILLMMLKKDLTHQIMKSTNHCLQEKMKS